MKSCILIISLIFWNFSFSQEGFKTIYKAEKLIQKNKLNRAMKLLCQADSMDYGFCGNAKLEAKSSIAYNKSQIYYKQGNLLQAINSINSANFGFFGKDLDQLDSTTIVYCIDLYGKEKVKQEIDSALTLLKVKDLNYYFYSEVPLKLGFLPNFLYLEIQSNSKELFWQGKSEDEKMELLKSLIREKSFYKLLEN
ncbi:MAG: hypothetical protein ACK5B9_10820 [Flavobacteriia bacterium]|jgi:hypothetical protein